MQQFGEEKTTVLMSNGPEQWQEDAGSEGPEHTHTHRARDHLPPNKHRRGLAQSGEASPVSSLLNWPVWSFTLEAQKPPGSPTRAGTGGASGWLVRWAGTLTLCFPKSRGQTEPRE